MRRPILRRPPPVKQLRRGVYLLPSLFTVGNMFCGFLAVIESSRGHF